MASFLLRRSTTGFRSRFSSGPAEQAHQPLFVINAELKRLIGIGRLRDARNLFDEMPHRDRISWTIIISGYLSSSDAREALSLFSRLLSDHPSLPPDEFLLPQALKACSSSSFHVRCLHAMTLKSGFLASSVFVSTALLDAYGKAGLPEDSLEVFDEMPQRNVVSWTSAITTLVHSGRHCSALRCFTAMRASGVPWDSHTITVALKACSDAGLLSRGREVHAFAAKRGLDATSYVANTLAAMYSKRSGDARDGLAMFDRMPVRDVASWTNAVATYTKMGRPEDAVRTFATMLAGGVGAVRPNEHTYAAVLSACAELAEMPLGQQLHAHVAGRGLGRSPSVSSALLKMYARSGQLDSADKVFDEMTLRDVVSWSAVVAAHAQEGDADGAFRLFAGMRGGGIRPNEFALSSLLSACAASAMLEPGKQVHARALADGLDAEPMAASALISMYSKCGALEEARRVFDEMPVDEVVSWTAMISGYAEHGLSSQAIRLFDEMLASGIRPDHVAFVGVLTACTHSGLVDVGFRCFEAMRRHGVEPGKEHYGCMVDLLGRSGRLREAEKLVEGMPHEPDDVVWSALLRACGACKDVELGRRVAERILAARPECAGTHITLSNMYAAEGSWSEAAKVRRAMRSKGVRKEAGWSWVDAGEGGGATVFTSADWSHPREAEIQGMLELIFSSSELEDESLGKDSVFGIGG